MKVVEISVAAFGGERVVALADETDAPRIAPWAWRLGTDGYARRVRRNEDGPDAPVWIAMHREVLGLHRQRGKPGDDVDHVNGNRLDNRRANLRRATRSENNMNRPNRGPGFRGVSFYKFARLKRPWTAFVWKDGKQHFCGYFATAEEAAMVRDAKARELFGDRATLNFPERFA